MAFSSQETEAANRLIDLALQEDWNEVGDLTCQAVMPAELKGQAVYVARKDGVVAGLPIAPLVYSRVPGPIAFEPLLEDGTRLTPGTILARVKGSMASVLMTERVILNFLQRLSGIATQTRRYVDLVADLPVKILDTRKTTPGWRLLEKYAVRQGGGHNHRMGLYDGVMLKDNHLAALARSEGAGSLARAVQRVRQVHGQRAPIEVEIDSLSQLDEALSAAPEVIMLDNMAPDSMREAVRRRNLTAPNIQLEASGGVTMETLRAIAETGVDRISIGALTHSAPALDIALDYQT